MKHAYSVQAVRGKERRTIPCASAWGAVERRDHLMRKGWKAGVVDHAGMPLNDSLLEALAQAELDAAARSKGPG